MPVTEPVIVIREERQKAVLRRHPWIFSGAVKTVTGDPADGDLVTVRAERGEFLARGYWNSRSSICVRLLSWDEDQPIDEEFWRERLRRAIAARQPLNRVAQGTPAAYRLVNAENDGLPGLVVDRYGEWLVIQALTLGIEVRKEMLAGLLEQLMEPAGIYERSDVDVRAKEGLAASAGLLGGSPPPEHIEIDENGRRFLVDVRTGHKTGFYLDQRENREIIGDWFRWDEQAAEREVLNAFAYTGGFAVYALGGLARRVVNVDTSAEALKLARRNIALNGYALDDDDFVEGDVFSVLRYWRDQERHFDMIILDPPKFAPSAAHAEQAARAYRDINIFGFRLLNAGGLLMTYSCSGGIDRALFQRIVADAAVAAGREARIVRRLDAPADHPVALNFSEGDYLKGLLCQVD